MALTVEVWWEAAFWGTGQLILEIRIQEEVGFHGKCEAWRTHPQHKGWGESVTGRGPRVSENSATCRVWARG